MSHLIGIEPSGPGRPASQVYEEVMERLDALTPYGGPVHADATIEAERFLGIGRTELYRDVIARRKANPRLKGRPAFKLPTVLVALYYAYGGNVTRLYDRLVKVGWPNLPGTSSSFWRWFNNLDDGMRDYMNISTDGLMARFPFEQWVVEERNRVWHIDCVRLKIRTPKTDSRRDTPQHRWGEAWAIIVWEGSDRYLLAVAVVDSQPTSADVQGVLASAMRLRAEGPKQVIVGGVPSQVITDNGAEFIADATTRFLAIVGAEQRVIRPHMKQLNGKAERNGKSFTEELVAGLPNQTRTPIKWNGSDTMTVTLEKSVSAKELDRRAQKLRHWWNWEHKHRMLQATPGAATAAKTDPFNVLPAGILEPYMPVAEWNHGMVTYERGRINHKTHVYILTNYANASSAPCELTIRHPHGDTSVLYGFYRGGKYDGLYFGTFTRADSRTPEDSVALENYRIKTTNLCADLAAAGAIFQAAIDGAEPAEAVREMYGNTLDNVHDYEWVSACIDENTQLLLRKGSDEEAAFRASKKKSEIPPRRRGGRKVSPHQGLLFLEADGALLPVDFAMSA